MARKGRVQVKKKVVRRKPRQDEPRKVGDDAGDAAKPAPLNLEPMAAGGVSEDVAGQLAKTHRSLIFASILQYLGAALCLGWGIAALIGRETTGGGGTDPSTLQAGTLIVGLKIAAAVLGITIFLALAVRMHRLMKAAEALEKSRQEEDLEFALGYLRGVWMLLGGSFIALLAIGGIVGFLITA